MTPLKTLKEEEIIELCFNDRYMSDLENKERTTEEESLFKILSEERQRQWTRLEAMEKRIDRVLLGQDKIDQDCREIAQDQQKIARDQQKIAREFSFLRKQIEDDTLFYKQWNLFFDQLRCAEAGNHYY